MSARARAASRLHPRLQHPLLRSRLSCLSLQAHACRAAGAYRAHHRAHTHLGAPPRPRRPPAPDPGWAGSSVDAAEVCPPPAAWSTSSGCAEQGQQAPGRGERRAGGGRRTPAPRNTMDSSPQGRSAQYGTQARLARVEMGRAAPRDGPALSSKHLCRRRGSPPPPFRPWRAPLPLTFSRAFSWPSQIEAAWPGGKSARDHRGGACGASSASPPAPSGLKPSHVGGSFPRAIEPPWSGDRATSGRVPNRTGS